MTKPFVFKQFTVTQNEDVFKVGTDACLLGCLVRLDDSNKTILEIGSGTGVVSLILAQRSESAKIEAIDINDQAVHISKSNFDSSPWADRLEVSHKSFLELGKNPKKIYDLIISNPPFFKDSILSENESMALARHEQSFTLRDFILVSKELITPKGKIALILPYQRRDEFRTLLDYLGLHESNFIAIHPNEHSSANRFISEIVASPITCSKHRFVLYKDINVLSDEAIVLLRPFYLRL